MLFDAYIVVDWSASAVPKRGADSIWYAVLRRDDGRLKRTALANPATRMQAMTAVEAEVRELVDQGRRVLVGFDFPNAYPRGFSSRAGFDGAKPWCAIWDGLDHLIEDSENNANNRFEVAAELNRRISGGAFPFWGCPPSAAAPTLTPKKTRVYDDDVPERRLCESWMPKTQPCWKLYTTGSVGSQALLGIPMQRRLRQTFAKQATVWPFETGMAVPATDAKPIVIAEVYPSMVPVEVPSGTVKDAAQVETLARHFARRDAAGLLAVDFAGPALSKADRRLVEIEEGWILGVGTEDAEAAPITDPSAIYERSFAIIRSEADLSRVPADAEPLAVRLIHGSGMADLVDDLEVSDDLMASATAALRAGAPILCDVNMVASGVTRRLLPADNDVICTLGEAKASEGNTRSAAAVDLWRGRLEGAVVAIGNAPTALMRLLTLVRDGVPAPAAVLGFPVGFVGAVESKRALSQAGLPYATVHGRRGGSAMAAAAVNAIAEAAR